jgi:acyl-CoA dehydrogenase
VQRAMHLHGALGISNEMPFAKMMVTAQVMAVADGPTEVHKITIARQMLKGYKPHEGFFPSDHLPERVAAAKERFAEYIQHDMANALL